MINKLETLKKLFKEDKSRIPAAIYNNLISLGVTNLLTDEQFLKLSHKIKLGYTLDLETPKTFNEKMQWLKLYNRQPHYASLVDKISSKDFVGRTIGYQHIIPTLAIWDSAENIDITNLPNQFVLKCNHDSGSVIICRDKNNFDLERAKLKLGTALKKDYYSLTREWAYKQVQPKIFAEQYMELENGGELIDYKFFCFHGEPQFLYVSRGLENHETATIDFYDMNFTKLPVERKDYRSSVELHSKPRTFEQMSKIAKELSQGLPFVRLDLYDINGTIYFSEYTLYASAGWLQFEPLEWDYKFGECLNISKIE